MRIDLATLSSPGPLQDPYAHGVQYSNSTVMSKKRFDALDAFDRFDRYEGSFDRLLTVHLTHLTHLTDLTGC